MRFLKWLGIAAVVWIALAAVAFAAAKALEVVLDGIGG